jgi:tryptophan-rich sensory protein
MGRGMIWETLKARIYKACERPSFGSRLFLFAPFWITVFQVLDLQSIRAATTQTWAQSLDT